MRILLGLPFLVIPVAAYHVLVYITATPVDLPVFSTAMPSQATFAPGWGHLLIALGLLFLYIEIFKATRTGTVSIVDHMLSMLLMLICVVEFILLPEMATGTFLVLTLMTLIDVIAGFTVTIVGARRDFGVNS